MSDANAITPRPNPRTPRILCAILGALALLALWRDPMYAWQPALAAALICLSPRASVLALAVASSLLLLVGGAVTTYRVGMAVPDWPQTMGQGMFSYPLDEMLESGWGVTLEHSHRLWATLVGLISILVVLTMWFRRAQRGPLLLAVISLLVVITQGVLGGTRVIENDQQLAFVHGAFAQVFYALAIALLVVTSAGWQGAARGASAGGARLRVLSDLCVGLVFGQVVLGAWLRHSGTALPLALHVIFAIVVFGAVLLLARSLRRANESFEGAPESATRLLQLRRLVLIFLHSQVLLGVLALTAILVISEGFAGRVSVAEAIFATLHVAVGAMLLGSVLACSMWSRRLFGAQATSAISVSGTSAPAEGRAALEA